MEENLNSYYIQYIIAELPDGTFAHIYGVADRVDICRKGNDVYVRVVDYKSGKKDFSLKDIELGLINMVLETIAMQSVFAARSCGVKDIVLTGNLSTIPQAKATFLPLSDQFDVNFIIPDNSQFATVIGAALDGKKVIKKLK